MLGPWKKLKKESLQFEEESVNAGKMRLGDFWPQELLEAAHVWNRKVHPEELDAEPCL